MKKGLVNFIECYDKEDEEGHYQTTLFYVHNMDYYFFLTADLDASLQQSVLNKVSML